MFSIKETKDIIWQDIEHRKLFRTMCGERYGKKTESERWQQMFVTTLRFLWSRTLGFCADCENLMKKPIALIIYVSTDDEIYFANVLGRWIFG